MKQWPWKETTNQRLRRMLSFYRDALLDNAPLACERIDDRMKAWGQGWLCNDDIVDVDEMLSARELSERHGISVHDVFNWERQGLYEGERHKGEVLFRQGDILRVMG